MILTKRMIAGELTPERLEHFESKIDGKLIDDYRRFMLENNGGVPANRKLYLTLDANVSNEYREWTELDCFYSIHDNAWIDSYEKRHGIPLDHVLAIFRHDFPGNEDCIPIGQDEYGNLIGMATSGELIGSVYFFDHEEGDRRYLASSFTEFCSNLLE